MNFLLRALALCLTVLSVTATAQPVSRVGSMSVYNYMNGSYKIDDSAKFYYTGVNPGTVTWPVLEAILGRGLGEQSWFAADNSMLYDSALVFYNNSLYYTYTQTLNGNKISARAEKSSAMTRNESFTYNSNGQLVEAIESKMVMVKTNCYYNSSNKIDSMQVYSESGSSWTLQHTYYHTYNTAGKLVQIVRTSPFNLPVNTYYDYDMNGFISKTSINVALDTHYVYNFTNATNGNVMEMQKRSRPGYNPVLLPMQNWEWHKYSYNSSNNKTGDLTLYWNNNTQVWDTFMNGTYSYNANNQLEKFVSLHWDKTTKVWAPRTDTSQSIVRKARIVNYYYDITWPTSIASNVAQNEAMNIYPVPAAGMINIYVPLTEKQEIFAAIVDMQGRTLRSWKGAATKEYRGSIPVSELPAGNYLLKVNGMVKQFVVQ